MRGEIYTKGQEVKFKGRIFTSQINNNEEEPEDSKLAWTCFGSNNMYDPEPEANQLRLHPSTFPLPEDWAVVDEYEASYRSAKKQRIEADSTTEKKSGIK